MFASFIQKVDQVARHLVPLLSCLLFILAGTFVWPLPYFGAVTPAFGLAAIYYWAIYRPDLLRPAVVFFLGLLNDALNFFPLGLSAFVFIGVYQLSFGQRRFFVGQAFLMLWSGFALVAFLSFLVIWIFLSFVSEQSVAVVPVFVQFLLTCVLFPLPAWALNRLQRLFLSNG